MGMSKDGKEEGGGGEKEKEGNKETEEMLPMQDGQTNKER